MKWRAQKLGDYVVPSNWGRFADLYPRIELVGQVIALLRSVLEKSPHHADKGAACVGLADFLRIKANLVRRAQSPMAPEQASVMEANYGLEEMKRLRAGDPAKLEAEAEKLYERVLKEFTDIVQRQFPIPPAQRAKSALFELRNLALGKTVPEIDGQEIDGTPLKLSDYRGKVVVLTFWSTTSARSLALIAHETDLAKLHKYNSLVILGTNGDEDRIKLRKWLTDNPLSWKSWWDNANDRYDAPGQIAQTWNVTSWPTVYVIDHRGVIRYRDISGKELDESIDKLLKEKSTQR